MPKEVSELTEGVAYAYSSEGGQVAASQPRVFRVLLESPTELINIEETCGVFIGDELREGAGLFCTSFDARFEAASRMSLICTFQFRTRASTTGSAGGQDPSGQPPDVRPVNWTTSTTLVEAPRTMWARRNGVNGAWGDEEPAVNPVGDIYDGVTALQPVVNISITQYDQTDPTKHNLYAGHVNEEQIVLGSLSMGPGTVLFRGVSSTPTVESWGGEIFRGWSSVYEFAYKRNTTKVIVGGLYLESDIGWDIAVPVTGYNVRAFNPADAENDEDYFAQPLRHTGGRVSIPITLPDNLAAGSKARAMVKVFEYDGGGYAQTPSASPVALKLNGRPLLTHNGAGTLINKPLVYAYRVQPVANLTQLLQLRLQ